MLHEIVFVGEIPGINQRLNSGFAGGPYGVLCLKTVAEAVIYLRNPECHVVTAVFSNVTMRREQDFRVLSEISAIHPHLQILLRPENGKSLPAVLPINNKNIRALQNAISPEGLFEVIQKAAETATALMEDANKQALAAAADGDDDSLVPFSTSFLMRVGMADVPVLLHGETGSGKEVMARRLCAYSPRANKPFLKLNCAALPSELVESELFGYEKGAFTGAIADKPGKFEVAQGGTILLDEIGDMDTRLQAKLLQVLQDGEIQPLGSHRTVKVNVRMLAATHRDLPKAIKEGTFREDLYYRLNVINIVIPPLRERRNEIPHLAESLLRKHLRPGAPVPPFTEELKQLMLEYHWPGNVRELENMMRRFLVYQNATRFANELRLSIQNPSQETGTGTSAVDSTGGYAGGPAEVSSIDQLAEQSRQAESKLLLEALEATRWNRRQAAARLKMEYRAFLYKLNKYGISEKKEKPEILFGA